MRVARSLLMLLRLLIAVQLVVGVGLWLGYWAGLVGLHMALGSVFVLTLWGIAGIALAKRGRHETAAAALSPLLERASFVPGANVHGAHAGQAGAVALNSEITRQATMVAYVDDFRLMLAITLFCIPMLFFMRTPKRAPSAEPLHAAVD